MNNLLIQLTDNDKRLIICLLLIFILVFVLAGFVGLLVQKIMRFQGKRADDMLFNVVKTGVITKPSKLRSYGYRKNVQLFFKQVWIPICIMLFGTITYFICSASYGYLINLHDYGPSIDGEIVTSGGEGWTTLFFVWDLKNPMHGIFFGMNIISGFPLLSKPHFEVVAIPSYIFFFTMVIGGIWYFVAVQAYIARGYRIWKLSKTVFNKSLENVTGNDLPLTKGGASMGEIMKTRVPTQGQSNIENNNNN